MNIYNILEFSKIKLLGNQNKRNRNFYVFGNNAYFPIFMNMSKEFAFHCLNVYKYLLSYYKFDADILR